MGTAGTTSAIVGTLGAVLLLGGELLALRSVQRVRRALLLSTVAELGLVLVGAATGTVAGMGGALLHLGYQVVMRGLALLALRRLGTIAGSTDLAALRGSGARAPLASTLFAFGLFSTMGLSPFKGSASRFLVLGAAVAERQWFVVAACTAASVVAAVCLVRIVQEVCLVRAPAEAPRIHELEDAPVASALLIALAVASAAMTVHPGPLLAWASRAVGGALPEFEAPWPLAVLVPHLGAFVLYAVGRASRPLRSALAVALATATAWLAWSAPGLDALALLYARVVAVAGLLVVVYSTAYARGKAHEDRYWFFLFQLLASLVGVATSRALGDLYVFWELMTWTSYLLVVHDGSERALHAGLRYFATCAGAAYVMLIGILALQASAGTLELARLAGEVHRLSPGVALAVAAALGVGFGVKAGLVPAHGWLPLAHPVAPAPASALLSAVLTKAGLYGLLLVVLGLLAPAFAPVRAALLAVGAATLLYGEVKALREDDLKKLLAYSTLAQVGAITTVLALGTASAIAAALVHLVVHAATKGLLFLGAGALIDRTGAHGLRGLRGAGRAFPLTGACVAAGILSIAALPPLGGFASKFLLVYAAADAGALPVVALLLAGGLLGAMSYLRVARALFLEEYTGERGARVPLAMQLPLVALAGACVAFGLAPSLPVRLVADAARFVAANAGLAAPALPSLALPLSPAVVAAMLGAVACAVLGRWLGRRTGLVAAAALAISAALLFAERARHDPPSLGFALLVAVVGAVNAAYAVGYFGHHDHALGRFFFAFTAMVAGLLGMATSRDLFGFFAAWEVMSSWTLYLAIAHEETPEALADASKYFVFNFAGASLLLAGVATLGSRSGTLRLDALAGGLAALPPGWLALAASCAVAGLALKAAVLPLRIDWQMHPPAAPTPVSGYVSAVLLKSGPFGLVKLAGALGGLSALARIGGGGALLGALGGVAAITLLLAGALAVLQTGVKRLLIYSTVSQLAYVLLGLSLATPLGVAGGLLHLATHALAKDLLFLCAGCILAQAHVESLDQLGGLGRRMPMTFGLFLFGALSVAGVPPLPGFASKWLLYQAALQADHPFLALACLLSSVFTLAAVLKFAHAAFLGQPSPLADELHEAPWSMRAPMLLLAAAAAALGLLPGLALVPIAAIQRWLGMDAVSASMFGPLPGASWHPAVLAGAALLAIVIGRGLLALGARRRRVTAVHTCGVGELPLADTHVSAAHLYPAPTAWARRGALALHAEREEA